MHNCFKETAGTFLSSTGLQLPVDYNMDVDKRKGIYLKVNTETFIYVI
jgi:glucose-induced degradation protein 8